MNTEEKIHTFRRDYTRLRTEIGKTIVGHDTIVEGTLIAILAGGHVLLEGVPGLGKTLLVRTLSEVLDLSFNRIQFTPDLMPADIVGHESGGGESRWPAGIPVSARARSSPTCCWPTKSTGPRPRRNRRCWRRCRRSSVTAGGQIRNLAEPFFVLATQNPIDQEGTYPLPEAQLDRFFFKLLVGYPSAAELTEVLHRTTEGVPTGH